MSTHINSSGAICTTGLITAQDLTDIANFYRNTFTVQFSPVEPKALATAADFNNLRNAILIGAGTSYLAKVPDSVSSENNLIATTTWPPPVALSFDIPKTATTIGTTVFSGPEGTNLLQAGSANMFFPFKGDTTEEVSTTGTETVKLATRSFKTINEYEPDEDQITAMNSFESSYKNNPPAGYHDITFSTSDSGKGPARYNPNGALVNEWVTTTVIVYGTHTITNTSSESVQGDTVSVTITTDGKIVILINYKNSWPGHATDDVTIDKSYHNYSDFVVNGKLQATLHFIAHA